jgi:hypothetical protein
MMVKAAGDIGFVLSGIALVLFPIMFLTSVRWWSDWLGRIIAAMFTVIGLLMALSMIRLLGVPLAGLFWWRAFLFPSLAVASWAACIAFIWSQFIAPRVRGRKIRKGQDVRQD